MMQKITYLKSLLLLCALIVGSGTSWAADKWVKTDPADLKTGDVVVIVDQTSARAMSNDNGTSSAPAATEVTLNDDKSEITSSVAGNLQWVVTVTDGSYQFEEAGTEKYLYCTNTNNGVRVGTNENNAFTIKHDDAENADFLYNTATSRYLGVYNSQDWRCYTSINSNIKTTVTAFYKKTSDVDPGKTDVTLSFPKDAYTADIAVGATSFTAPTATATPAVTGITYSSSNEAVATVNETTGAVTLVKKGTTTITASFAGNNTYNPAEASYTLTVTNSNANDGTEAKPFTVEEAIDFITAKEYGEGNYYVKGIISSISSSSVISGGYLTYCISDDGTETNQLKVYKGKNLDNEEFTSVDDIEVGDAVVVVGPLLYYNNNTPEINTGNYIVSRKTKADPALTVEENVELYVGQQKAVSEFYLIEDDYAGVMSFESSDEDVAKVEGDVLKALAVGTAVITVTAAADANYKMASETFTVTVKSMDVTPEGSNASSFVKVTETADITDGEYLIVYEGDETHAAVAFDGSLETLDAASNGIAVSITDSKITATDALKAATFTIDVTNGTLQSASGKYIGVSSNSNGLKETEDVDTYTNSFAIDNDGNAVINAVFDGSTMALRYNYASNQLRFRYFKNAGQQPIALYKLTETSTFDIEMGASGYRTIVSAKDATLPTGLAAYVVTANEGGKATLSEVDNIKANKPYVLKGAAGTYTLTIADEATAPTANLLQVSDGSQAAGVYVLANHSGTVGFYKWNGGTLGVGRVYLPTTVGAPDYEFISIEGDGISTGIDAVDRGQLTMDNGEVYNLNGQRVAQPTKGLYIVNGKKYVIK